MAKILIHTLVFSPDGVSTAYLMTDLALELKKMGHEIVVLTTTPHFNILPESLKDQPLKKYFGHWLYSSALNGIKIWHVKMPLKKEDATERIWDMISFHFLSLVFGFTLAGSWDVVLSPSPPLSIGVISWLLGLKCSAPSIYNVQEIYPDFAIRQNIISNPFMVKCLKFIERFVYARSKAVTAIAESFRKVIESRVNDRNKLKVIPNFVDIDLYKVLPRDNQFSRQYGLLEDFLVSYSGNIGIAQEWDVLLFAASELKDLPIKFLIVGDGVKKPWLEEEVRKRNLNNILILEYQPRTLMPWINASSDLTMILLTKDGSRDGFPSKIYTTMACGKPSIVYASTDSELASIVEQSGCGRLIPIGNREGFLNAIVDAYHCPDTLRLEGEKGRQFIEKHFSKEVVARQYNELIIKLIAKRKK